MLRAIIKLTMLLGLVSTIPLFAWAAEKPTPTAEAVGRQAETAVAVRAGSQKLAEAFTAQRAELLDGIDALEAEIDSVNAQRKKTERYLAGQRAKVNELNHRLAEIAKLKTELEPELDQSLERLGEFVERDLPFLASERRARLIALAETLDDYDQGLSFKTRRLLEVLLLEARYGHGVEVSEGEVKDGDRALRVRLIRLGRLALFALSPDGRRAWRFDPAGEKFLPLTGGERELGILADIAQRRRVVSLVEVPLGQSPLKAALQ